MTPISTTLEHKTMKTSKPGTLIHQGPLAEIKTPVNNRNLNLV